MAHANQERWSKLVDAKLRNQLVTRDNAIFNSRYEGDPKSGKVKIPVRDTEVEVKAYDKGADEAGHVSDVLLTTQNLGKTSVDELAGSMGRVIPLAAAYNVSLENLSSGLAIMTANGIATAEASTYTKSMLNELGDTGSTVGKILKQQTGKSFAELNADGKSLGDVLQVLYDSVGGNATKFAGLWSSVEAGTGALSLASSGADKFNGVLQQMQADSGATQTAYDTMTDTMAYKLDGVKTNAQNLGTALFDAVSGRLGEGVALAGGYLQTLSESVQQNGIAGLAQGLAAVFTDLTTNIGPQLLQTGTALLGKLGDGLVTGIPQLLAQALPVVANLASGLRENAGQLVDAGIQFILNLATGLMNGLPTMITYLPGIVSDIAGIINDNAPKLLVAGVQLIVTLGQGLIQRRGTAALTLSAWMTPMCGCPTTRTMTARCAASPPRSGAHGASPITMIKRGSGATTSARCSMPTRRRTTSIIWSWRTTPS